MRIHRRTLYFFVISIALVSCLPSCGANHPAAPVPQIIHTVDNLSGIESVWTLEDIFIIWNPQDITLDSFRGKTCFLGDIGKRDLYKNFICLESQTGRLLWSKENGIQRTIAMAKDGIFIAYSSPGELKKFDIETGELIARKKLGGTGSIYLSLLNDEVQVTTASSTLWILDTNAELLDQVKVGTERIFISTQDATYVDLNGLQVRKPGTDEVVWEHIDTNLLTQIPLFTNSKIVVRNGNNLSGTAYALDRENGKLLWETSDILGNLVYSPEKRQIYALQENGDLLAINESNGETSVIATFSPNAFTSFDGVDTCTYQLSYDAEKKLLIVYLGDSKQLFAFQEN